ncbi:hypothetical protein Tco_0656999 [Tanacetum coccineum]|uniref:MAK10-like protein n=1 Tax=Tanacetum coccineum TaxID=301880 RepID=A0ABQ4XBG9_9ASTR
MAEYSKKWYNGTSRTRSTKTSDRLAAIQAQLNNLGREIKKVNEKVYAAQVGCEQCKGPHYTNDFLLKEEGKTLEEAYYTQIGAPFQEGGYRAIAPRFYQRNNANPSYQERRKSIEDTLSKFMTSTDAAIRNQEASIKTLEIQIGQMSKVLQERGFGSLPRSTKTNPRDHVKSISTIVETDSYPIRRMGSSQYAGSYGQQFLEAYSEASHINNSIPRKEKDPGSFTLPCFINNVCFDNALVDLRASKVYMLSIRERMELDLEARLMGETLVLNRSLDPFFDDYIELNDLNVPLELRRDQVDDLMSTIEEGEVIEEFRARNDTRTVSKVFGYPSDCDCDKKIHMDCTYNLKFSCMIVLEDMDAYRDEGMGDVIFGEPFLREFEINARRFDRMIIINGNEEVTYQMVRSHTRSLELRAEYVRDAKVEEWLTRGHIYVHEMELEAEEKDLAESKEIDNVDGESMKSGSVGVLKLQDGCSTQILAHKLKWVKSL